MSLVEEYYELNETEQVSAIWKGLQICFYAAAGCLSLGCGFTLAILRLRFDDRCYLFTKVKASHSKNGRMELNNNINWESDSWCDYYQFSMVSSFIVAFIWATLFLMCGKGGKSLTGLPQPWRIVWPSLIFNFIYFLIVLSTAISIHQGTNYFCGRDDFDKTFQVKSSVENCETLKLLLKKDLSRAALQIEVVLKTCWGCTTSWFILFLLSFFRIVFVVDFQLYKICVFKIDSSRNKKEEILKITNYEEPRKLYHENDEGTVPYSESEESSTDLELGTGKTAKVDKKMMRQHFNSVNRVSLSHNTTFYVTTDIRMLKRDRKRDVSYGNRYELRKVINRKDLSARAAAPTFLFQYSESPYSINNNDDDTDNANDYGDDDDDNDGSCGKECSKTLTFRPQRQYSEVWHEFESDEKLRDGRFDPQLLKLKKQI